MTIGLNSRRKTSYTELGEDTEIRSSFMPAQKIRKIFNLLIINNILKISQSEHPAGSAGYIALYISLP